MKSLRVVVLVSVFCLVLMPLLITRSHAGREEISKPKIPNLASATMTLAPAPVQRSQQVAVATGPVVDAGPVDPAVYEKLGLGPSSGPQSKASGISPSANMPINMRTDAALSTAVMTNIAKGFQEVDTLGDWDGKEDDTADHGGKPWDSTSLPSAATSNPNFFITRSAFSEHTIANGFPEDVFYAGDSLGNVYVGFNNTPATAITPTPAANVLQINLPTVLNAFGTLNSNNTIVVTGIAVSPVCDLNSFARVNGAYAPYFPAGTVGEILYVTFEDTSGGFRLLANGQLIRSGLLAFPVSDAPNASPTSAPGLLSPNPFPVTVGSSFGVVFSVFSNLAGVAIDDDGSAYLQQVDLSQFTGGNIVKVISADSGGGTPNQDRSLATSGFLTLTSLNPINGQYGTSSGPANQINFATNYSGTSNFMANAIALATGSGNVLYAAMARSLNPADDAATQATESLFTNPVALGATPSMIITFADAKGKFDNCSSPDGTNPTLQGVIPIGDGIADPIPGAGSTNWRAFVLGNGPDNRAASGTNSLIFGTPTNTLKLDMSIDYSIYSGVVVDEQNTLYAISGGAPAGIGNNPSPSRGEILEFEDNRPADRRADYDDFRADAPPIPPASGGITGDGDSDRFDHLFYQAPIDVSSLTPAGLSGLSRGFLRYTNRQAPTAMSPGVTLGSPGAGNGIQGDDSTSSAVIRFDDFDPSHQVAGGDDAIFPFSGDDNDGAGNPAIPGASNGGFEFTFGGPVGTANCVWNGFFLNSNGNITFGAGDTDNTATDNEFRSGLPRIAPAWTDLNPNSKAGFNGTFPVQAMGFSGINSFKVSYINVPEFGAETCAQRSPNSAGMTNTFSVTLYDDGTGIDENANQPLNPANPIGNNAVAFDLQEGSTANRWVNVSTGAGNQIIPEPPRPDGSGFQTFVYGRMDLLGTSNNPVVTGYSVGNLAATNPPGLCEIELGGAALAADTTFGNIQGQIESTWPTFLGDGSEPEVHEFFHAGVQGFVDGGTGVITVSQPDFDLRFEGNGDATPAGQIQATDVNRDHIGLAGDSCAPPAPPVIFKILPNPFQVTPTTNSNSLINAYAPVTVNLLGSGFFPNSVVTICPASTGDAAHPEIVVPTARPGNTISSAAKMTVDTNSDGVPDTDVLLTSVTPVSRNLVTATLAPLPNASGTGAGSPFPFLATGGVINGTVTTSFTAGDNNVFGAFTRSATNTIDAGARAPVVVSSSPSSGDSAVVQNLTISGFDFQYSAITQIPSGPAGLRPFTVTGVTAVQRDNPANVINATSFNVLNNTTINATFNFNNAQLGKQFLIFVTNAAGSSRNALTAPGGASPNGNEQGNLILFTVTDTTNPTITCPANQTVNAAAGASSAVVNYPAPVATDNQPGVTVNCTKASGSSFNVGNTTVTCTATDTSNNTASCSFNVNVVGSNSMHLSSSTYSGAEAGCNSLTFTVVRDNPTASGTASIDVVTSDGTAVQKSDYGFTSATVTFNPGETSKSFTVPLNDDGFVEGPETFTLTASNPQNGFAGNGPLIATATITDDDLVPPPANINDTASVFVCQHYHDFLNRDPDAPGAAFWTGQITACGVNATCIQSARVQVSASFFLSIEFQETGGNVLRIQRTAFGARSDVPLKRYPYASFMRDAQQVGRGVIIGQPGAQATLDANKAAYATQVVSSAAFITAFPTSQTASQYVSALFTSAGVASPTAAETSAAITAFGAGGTSGRAAALVSVADSNSVRTADFNTSFVLMEYYGYLRRNPTDAPDNNDNGYQFWLAKLLSFGGDYIKAEMVKAFITSTEYRQRFGS